MTVLTSRIPDLGLAEQEDVPIEAAGQVRRKGDDAPRGRLTVVRLATSGLRFWGTWLYMRNLRRWFEQNSVDLAYVSMLKHDAFVTLGAGRRHGFPVVLRPEGAGATGDIAWQTWGNFGRRIGRRCRSADAFVAISKAVENELLEAWRDGTLRESSLDRMLRRPRSQPRIVAMPNGVPVPERPWQRRPDWRVTPRGLRRPAGARERARYADRRLARRPGRLSHGPADLDR